MLHAVRNAPHRPLNGLPAVNVSVRVGAQFYWAIKAYRRRSTAQRFNAYPRQIKHLGQISILNGLAMPAKPTRKDDQSAPGARPLLTLSPSLARKVQNDSDEIMVSPPRVRNA